MSAKFKCRLTGNIFEYVNDFDIADMRKHPQYDEIKEIPDGVSIKDRNYSANELSTRLQTKKVKDTKKEVTKVEE